MFVNPRRAFVGCPSVVWSSSGKAKNPRYARLLPSTRKSSVSWTGASSSSSSSPVMVFGLTPQRYRPPPLASRPAALGLSPRSRPGGRRRRRPSSSSAAGTGGGCSRGRAGRASLPAFGAVARRSRAQGRSRDDRGRAAGAPGPERAERPARSCARRGRPRARGVRHPGRAADDARRDRARPTLRRPRPRAPALATDARAIVPGHRARPRRGVARPRDRAGWARARSPQPRRRRLGRHGGRRGGGDSAPRRPRHASRGGRRADCPPRRGRRLAARGRRRARMGACTRRGVGRLEAHVADRRLARPRPAAAHRHVPRLPGRARGRRAARPVAVPHARLGDAGRAAARRARTTGPEAAGPSRPMPANRRSRTPRRFCAVSRCGTPPSRSRSTRSSSACRGRASSSRASRSTPSRRPRSRSESPYGSAATPSPSAPAGRSCSCIRFGARSHRARRRPTRRCSARCAMPTTTRRSPRSRRRRRRTGAPSTRTATGPPAIPCSRIADWASCRPALSQLGRVIVAGCRDATAARTLGFVPSHGIGSALEMAHGVAGGRGRVGILLAPPYPALVVG